MLKFASSSRPFRMPPPPHDPQDRVVLDVIDGWEVRVFEPGGLFDRYFKERGYDHLQLWHPPSGFSLLTPSRLTRNEFEVFPFANWKYGQSDYRVLHQTVRQAMHFSLPRPFLVETLMEVFIEAGSDDSRVGAVVGEKEVRA